MQRWAWAVMAVAVSAPTLAAPMQSDAIDDLLKRADALAEAGDARGGIALAERAVALADAERPRSAERRYRALQVLSLLQNRVDQNLLLPTLDRMAAVAEEGFGPDAHRTLWARFNALGFAFARRQPGATLAELARLGDRLEERSRDAANLQDRVEAATAIATVANLTTAEGNLAGASALAARATAIIAPLPPGLSTDIADVYVVLATIANFTDRPRDAVRYVDEGLAVYAASGAPDHLSVPQLLSIGATAAARYGAYEQADLYLRRAVAQVDRQPGLRPDIRMRAAMDYGLYLASTRRYDLAFPLIERGVALSKEAPAGYSLHREVALAAGRTYASAGRHAEAIAHLERGRQLAEAAPPSRTLAFLHIELARVALAQQRLPDAETSAAAARRVLDVIAPTDEQLRSPLYVLDGDIAATRGEHAAAAVAYRRALAGIRGLGASAAPVAINRVLLGTSLLRSGAHDGDAWREARAGADGLIADLVSTAQHAGGDRQGSERALRMLDLSIDVAWAFANEAQR